MRITQLDLVLIKSRAVLARCDDGDAQGAAEALAGLWPSSELEGELLAEALFAAGAVEFLLAVNGKGLHETAKDRFGESVRLFKEANNPKADWVEVRLAETYLRQGALAEGLDVLERILQTSSDPPVLLSASIAKAFGLTESGLPHEALRTLNAVEPMLDGLTPRGKFYNQRGIVFRQLKDLDRCLKDYKEAQYWFESANNLRYEAAVHNNLANVQADRGDFDGAHSSVDTAIRLYLTLQDASHLANSKDTKTTLFLKEGKLDLALEVATEAVRLLTGDDKCWLPRILITRGTILARLHSDKAKGDFLRAVSEAEQSGDLASAGCAYLTMIQELSLPVRERAEYYRRADSLPVNPVQLRECAKKIIGAVPTVRHKDDNERDVIREALVQHGGNVARAAKTLGLSGPGLAQKIDNDPELLKLRQKKRRRSIVRK